MISSPRSCKQIFVIPTITYQTCKGLITYDNKTKTLTNFVKKPIKVVEFKSLIKPRLCYLKVLP